MNRYVVYKSHTTGRWTIGDAETGRADPYDTHAEALEAANMREFIRRTAADLIARIDVRARAILRETS